MAAAEEFDSGDEEPVNRQVRARRGRFAAAAGSKPTPRAQFKVILLGDGAVGKTSVATRFSADDFRKQYKQVRGGGRERAGPARS